MRRRPLKAAPTRRSNPADPEQCVTMQLYAVITLTFLDVRGGGVVVPIILEFSGDLVLGESHKLVMPKSYRCNEKHAFSLKGIPRYKTDFRHEIDTDQMEMHKVLTQKPIKSAFGGKLPLPHKHSQAHASILFAVPWPGTADDSPIAAVAPGVATADGDCTCDLRCWANKLCKRVVGDAR